MRGIFGISRLVLVGAALSLVFGLGSTAAQDATPAGGMSVEEIAAVKADQPYKLLAVVKTLSNEYWQTMERGYQDAAAEKGVTIDVLSVPTEQDTEQQLNQLQTALAQGYDAIMVSPITPANLIPALVAANQAGIPIINVDERVDPAAAEAAGAKLTSVIASDNRDAGARAAQYMIDNIPDGGKVAIIEGKAGNQSGLDRKEGFQEAIETAGNFEIVASQPADWDQQRALDAATNILQANPDLVGFYAANDTMALGVVEAARAAGKLDQVVIIGTDAIPAALAAVQAGDMEGTVAQFPAEEARIATSLAILALQGHPVEGFIPSPIELITKDNVAEMLQPAEATPAA
ncbi:MAG TPA: substrate-binding domain-containing protein [Thermomicrobiales bacterium]|nr:substrate-binding domain-containing protein [Thermomicrobiales bacterium]